MTEATIRNRNITSAAKTLLLFAFVGGLAVLVGRQSPESLKGTDFPDFYCAARILAEGHGDQLYDATFQREYQARYTERVGTLYIHPPFEVVFYVMVALFSLTKAYRLWLFLNLVFLAAAVRRLTREILPSWDSRLLLAASLVFTPCLLCLLQGQDSLLLLLLLVLAFMALRRSRDFVCGCWLGLALFKFEIVLPIVLTLVLARRRAATSALARGFALVALLLAGVSAAISGWSVFSLYPRFLLHLEKQPFPGIAPQVMANFRGLAHFFFHKYGTDWMLIAITICSALALLKAVGGWKQARVASEINVPGDSLDEFDLAFGSTVLFAVLVSYHLNPHDLSLLLLPIFLFLRRSLAPTLRVSSRERWMTVALSVMLFLPLLHLWALRAGVYTLIGLPIVALFLVAGISPLEVSAPSR